jgi:enoyl-CoA hydratase/carnithine racemase
VDQPVVTQLPELRIEGAIAEIRLRDALRVNRLGPPELKILLDHIEAVNAARDVMVLKVSAEGPAFCAGFDVNALGLGVPEPHFSSVPDALERARPVTIAMMHAGAFGGGTDIVLACDFRFGAAGARAQVPAAALGLHFYLGGMQRYVSRMGVDGARRMLLACEELRGQELAARGYLTSYFDTESEMVEAADALAKRLAASAPLALLGMKRRLNEIARGEVNAAGIAADVTRSEQSRDLAEALAARKAKRPPQFTGD